MSLNMQCLYNRAVFYRSIYIRIGGTQGPNLKQSVVNKLLSLSYNMIVLNGISCVIDFICDCFYL